jgi:hypothetical protein
MLDLRDKWVSMDKPFKRFIDLEVELKGATKDMNLW